jgi:tetratricopeptide (TPR) repeat protein
MRTLNVRLAVILLVSLLVLGVGVRLLHGYQVSSNAAMLRKAADHEEELFHAAVKKQDAGAAKAAWKKFFLYLNLYVQLNPENFEQRERLGIAMFEDATAGGELRNKREFAQSFSMLENLLRQAPERGAARRQVVKMAMLMGRFQDAKYHLEKYLLVESPKDPKLLETLGQCQGAMSDFGSALATFKKAIAVDPSRLAVYAQAADLLKRRLKRPGEADALMKKMVLANPKSAPAHALRGRYLLGGNQSEIDEAIAEALTANKLAVDDADTLSLLATSYLTKGQYDEARGIAARGIKLFPSKPTMYGISADIELRAGKRERAVAVLRQGLQNANRNPALMWHLANLLIDADNLSEARELIEDMRNAKNYYPYLLDYLAARVEFSQEHWLAAKDGFEQVREELNAQLALQNTSNVAILKQISLWIGVCYGQLGNNDQQLAAYQSALNIDPYYAPARSARADLLMRLGRYNEALEEYKHLDADKQMTSASSLALAEMLFTQNLQKPPSEQNWKTVEAVLDEVEKTVAGASAVRIPILRADMYMAQNRPSEAENVLLAARSKHPQQAAYWAALAALAERQQDWKRTETILEEAEKTLGNGVELRLAQAQYWVLRYGKDAKERLHGLLKNTAGLSESDIVQLWTGLLNTAIQTGDAKQADLLSQELARKQPNNVRIRYLMFERALNADNREGMQQALKEIENIAGRGAYWQYGQATLLFLDAQKIKELKDAMPLLNQALDYLAKARELHKNWSRVPLAEANIYDRMGRQDEALSRYTDAIEQGERSPTAFQRTIQILFQKQQYAMADQWLSRMERDPSMFSADLEKAGVEIALQQGEFARALEKARKVVDAKSEKFQDHLWLGQILGIVGAQLKGRGQAKDAEALFADAERSLRQAVKLGPKSPATWVALIRFLTVMQKNDEAEAAVQDAAKNLPADQSSLALAQCYEIMKKPEAAKKKYDAALAAAPQNVAVVRIVADFYRRTEKFAPAEGLLQKIVDSKLDVTEDDVFWARRQFAYICAARGGFLNLQKAENLLEQNLAGPSQAATDRRELARLYAMDPRLPMRAKAIELFENLLQDRSASADDRMTLARLYLAGGVWLKAGARLRGIIVDYDREPRYLIAYIEALLQHKETSDVGMYIERLEKLIPNSFAAVDLRADLLCATHHPEQAFDLLAGYLDNKSSMPADRAVRLRLVAEKLAQLGRQLEDSKQKPLAEKFIQQAESLLREFIAGNAEQEILLAAFLGANGKPDEALNVLDRVWGHVSASNVAQTAAVILHNGNLEGKQLQRLNRIVRSAIKKFERPLPLLLDLAEICTAQKNYAEAVDIYREILNKDPKNVMVMNNLAVLLALRGEHLDEALQLVNQALEIAGPIGAILDSRAIVYIAMHESGKAMEDLQSAMADGETPVGLFHRAQACALAGRGSESKNALAAALKKGLTPKMLHPLERPVLEKMTQLRK